MPGQIPRCKGCFVAIGFGGLNQGEGVPRTGGGPQDLVESRAGKEACQLHEIQAPAPSRLLLGDLSKARNKWLQLVDSVRLEQRLYQTEESAHPNSVPGVLALNERYLDLALGFRVWS